MKTRILKLSAAFLTAIFLFAYFPILTLNVSAADQDKELREFVTRLYNVCLKRDPDDSGLDYWISELKDQKETGVAVASGFIFSPELQEKSYSNEDYVKVMYDAFFGREADTDGFNYWVKRMNDGMSRQDLFTGFANSQEFFDLCDSFGVVAGTFIPQYDFAKVNRTNFFVERLYNVVLGRKCDREGMMYWSDELLSGRISGTSAAYGFFFSKEYEQSNKYYSEYIDDLYNALMGRQADTDGRNYWLSQINGGSSKEHIFNGFASSNEFSGICSNYGILQGGTVSEQNNTTNTLRPDADAASPSGSSGSNGSGSNSGSGSNNGSGNSSTPATPTSSVVPVNTEVQIKNSNLTIMSGCSGKIEIVDKKGNVVSVVGSTFKSDNETVAVACEDGTVVGLSEGTATVTVNYAGNTSCVYVTVKKYVNSITSMEGALTPQQFGAKGDGKTDDTQAFRKMFAESIGQSYTIGSSGWRHCQTIYIPSGHYKITGAIFDKNIKPTNGKPLQFCMFEIYGAGRESTIIDFSGSVLFDSRSDDKTLFAFTTIRDIDFRGNNNNMFMNFTTAGGDGQQRMQFFSCGFGSFHTIIDCVKSGSLVMNSEITFAYCKIANCGNDKNKCQLFILTNPQAVNWRFDNTDIESFTGDAFLFKTGTGVTINNGSIIPGPGGCVFNFEINDQGNLGAGNAPQVLVIGARFEIHPGKTLLKTNSNSKNFPKVVFQYCNVNAAAYIKNETERSVSEEWMIIKGGCDVVFDTCYKCSYSRFIVDCTSFTNYVRPKVTFKNCPDMTVDGMVYESKVATNNQSLSLKNTLHLIVDDKYDLYLTGTGDKYYHTTSDIQQCRQPVDINADNEDDYSTTKITNGKTLKAKPYGYVEYVEITAPSNETWKAYPVYVTLYDGSKQISSSVKIDFSKSQTYQIPITGNNNYVNELSIKFSHSYNQDPRVNMNIVIVKK